MQAVRLSWSNVEQAVLPQAQPLRQLARQVDVLQLGQGVRIAAERERRAAIPRDGKHALVRSQARFPVQAIAVDLDGRAVLARGEKAARKFVVRNAVQDGLRVFRRAADGAEGVLVAKSCCTRARKLSTR